MSTGEGGDGPPGRPKHVAAGPAVPPYLGAWAACLLFCAMAQAAAPLKEVVAEDPWQARLPAFSVDGPPRGEAPILLYFTAPWCGFCRQLERTTLADVEVGERVATLRAHKIDHDSQGGLVKRFAVRGIPAFVLTNDRGDVLDRLTGAVTKDVFLKWLADGQTKAARAAQGAEERAAALARVAEDLLSNDEAVRERALAACWTLAGRGDDFERVRAGKNLEALLGPDSGASPSSKAAWWQAGLAHEDLAVRVAAAKLLGVLKPEEAALYDPWADEAVRAEALKRVAR